MPLTDGESLLTDEESLLIWMQGSIQATLAAAPLDLAFEYKQSMPLPRPHIAAWAEVIALIGVFSILIGSSMSWLAAALLGPILLNKVRLLLVNGRIVLQISHSTQYLLPSATHDNMQYARLVLSFVVICKAGVMKQAVL